MADTPLSWFVIEVAAPEEVPATLRIHVNGFPLTPQRTDGESLVFYATPQSTATLQFGRGPALSFEVDGRLPRHDPGAPRVLRVEEVPCELPGTDYWDQVAEDFKTPDWQFFPDLPSVAVDDAPPEPTPGPEAPPGPAESPRKPRRRRRKSSGDSDSRL